MITTPDLCAIMPLLKTSKAEIYTPILNAAMQEFEIVTPIREAAFLAQLAHESAQLRYWEELASGEAYDRRADLGNTKPEAIAIAAAHGTTPGRFWKGHGPIQITGYDNHLKCGEYLGIDCVNNPTLLCDPVYGIRGSGWFWHIYKNLNPLADVDDFRTITKRINGGFNGYTDRVGYYQRALVALGAA